MIEKDNVGFHNSNMISTCYTPSEKNDNDPHKQDLGLIQNKIWSISQKTQRRGRGVCCTRLLNGSLFNPQ